MHHAAEHAAVSSPTLDTDDVGPPGTASARAYAQLARTAALIRVATLVVWPLGALENGWHVSRTGWVAMVAQTAWSLVVVMVALRTKRVAAPVVVIDVGVAAACVLMATVANQPYDIGWNSATLPTLATAMMAAGFLRLWPAALAIGLLVATYLGCAAISEEAPAPTVSSLASTVLSLLAYSLVARLVAHHLVVEAERADRSSRALADARATMVAEEVRRDERMRQYRMLHDTVLSTLSAIARGGLNPQAAEVRQRCAADADYLRGIISATGEAATGQLQGELAAVGRQQSALGLRVHHHAADIPADLPDDVVHALADASREALNNVRKHSGTPTAWVTAVGDLPAPEAAETTPRITVTVADRGVGFDPDVTPWGLGMRESLCARLAEVGADLRVDSQPGQGTTIQMRWPA